MRLKRSAVALISTFVLVVVLASAVPCAEKIYWGNEVPKGWNGTWDARFLTVPEKTAYVRTASSSDIQEFIDVLRWNSENVSLINMFTTTERRVGTAVVLARPRVSTPEEALASGKPVIYLQGNIHPPEAEAKEALCMLMRDILFGKKQYLLDDLIIIVCPCFNVDGNDTWTFNEGLPHMLGSRSNALNYDLNRDALKLDTLEVNGLYRTIFDRWDPILIYDGHAMGRIRHGYAIVYATSTVPAADPGPRGYVFDKLFPAVREAVRRDYGLEVFTHCDFDEEHWPPTIWSHDRAIWSTEAKFIAAAYGLRNRMSILAETPGYPTFERRIYAHYALVAEILDHCARHGKEMAAICRKADQDTVARITAQAATGTLKNFTAGKYESWGKVDILAYRENKAAAVPGTSVMARTSAGALGAPEIVHGVEHLTKSVGTKEATVPRGYLIPAELGILAEKLRTMNVKVDVLDKPVKASGEEYVIDRMIRLPQMVPPGVPAYLGSKLGAPVIRLEGAFCPSPVKEFPAGTYVVDLAQPLANLAFYCLEPEAADGFTGWNMLTDYLVSIGVEKRSVVYPIYKYFKLTA